MFRAFGPRSIRVRAYVWIAAKAISKNWFSRVHGLIPTLLPPCLALRLHSPASIYLDAPSTLFVAQLMAITFAAYAGGMLGGVLVNSFFTGIVNVQAHRYYAKFPKDGIHIKLVVAILWMAQMIYLPINVFAVYYDLVTCQKNPLLLLNVPWEVRYTTIHILIVSTTAYIFFAIRLWAFGHDLRVMIPLALLIAASFSVGAVTCVWALQPKSIEDTSVFSYWGVSVFYGLLVATDSTISVYLSYLMLAQKRRIQTSSSTMNLIMLYGVTTGAVSSFFSIMLVISYHTKWLTGLLIFSSCISNYYLCCPRQLAHAECFAKPHGEASKTDAPWTQKIPIIAGPDKLFAVIISRPWIPTDRHFHYSADKPTQLAIFNRLFNTSC
ncbi:hypothetical protein DL93DRAFT_1213814 [Clavulina sp. PMI_390]|nr:hypothetical protein DL93DRAFT_1213814 [Clavulina sp. PMI_390]